MIRGLDEELADHKYAHVERERRFLVDPARCPDLSDAPAVLIEDRYITGARFRVRRMTDLASGRIVLKLSKKYDVADVRARPIVTAYLTEDEYRLFAAMPGHLLVKARHAVGTPSGTFGIDVFSGPLGGLSLAEIECPDDASLTAVWPPHWAVREVTDDARFHGGALASLEPASLESLLSAPK